MQKVEKILVIRFSSFGDIILTFPLIEALKNKFPESTLFFLTKKRYKSLLLKNPLIEQVIEFDQKEGHKNLSGFLKLIKNLKTYNFDLIIDLHSNLRSFFVRGLVNSKKKIKYNKRRFSKFSMVHFKFLKVKSRHTVDSYLDVLKKIKVEATGRLAKFHLSEDDKVFALDFLKKNGLTDGDILVGMAPEAKWETKRWDKKNFLEVGKTFLKKFRSKTLLVGGKDDRESLFWIGSELKENNVIYALDLPFNKLAGIIKRCKVFITNDSGPMHLSSSLGVPTIAIFGPTHPKLGFPPLGLMDEVLTSNERCSPCSLHGERRCFRDKKYCMEKITFEKVAFVAEKILNSQKVVFIDRDGTLIEDKNFLSKLEEVSFISKSVDAIKIFKSLGYKVVAVSNQSGIGRGLITFEDVEKVNQFISDELRRKNADVDGIYFCPHHPDERCSCRKPETGLIKKAKEEHNLNLGDAVIIGDKLSDILLGKRMSAKTILVLTGYGKKEFEKIKNFKKDSYEPDFVAQDLFDSALWVKENFSEIKLSL